MVFPRRKEQIIIPGIFCFFFGVHSEPEDFESYWKHCSSFFFKIKRYVLKIWGKYD